MATQNTLPGTSLVKDSKDELFIELGNRLKRAMTDAIDQRGICHIALSGGGTPEPFYVQLVTDPLYRNLPWHLTHIWMVDERQVPESDPKNNWKMIREAMADHLILPYANLHPMPTIESNPAEIYQKEMAETFKCIIGSDTPEFDFILLGMGGDAHTASLFPHSPALKEQKQWVVENDGEYVVPPARITLTYPVINASKHLAVLACGENKAQTLANVANGFHDAKDTSAEMPITGLAPKGELVWYMDTQAAANLLCAAN